VRKCLEREGRGVKEAAGPAPGALCLLLDQPFRLNRTLWLAAMLLDDLGETSAGVLFCARFVFDAGSLPQPTPSLLHDASWPASPRPPPPWPFFSLRPEVVQFADQLLPNTAGAPGNRSWLS